MKRLQRLRQSEESKRTEFEAFEYNRKTLYYNSQQLRLTPARMRCTIDALPPIRFGVRVEAISAEVASVFVCLRGLRLPMITNVYIDGFNLYYRALKRASQYKWLDLAKLSQALLPTHQINRVRYFTAILDERPDDPNQQYRQQVYLRALETIPNLSMHYGQFRTRNMRRPLAESIAGFDDVVLVKNTEEKGTDVNLASYLLIDGYERDCEQALVISNDSDLALPIRMVRDRLNLPVGVVNPNTSRSSQLVPVELREAATFLRQIRLNALRDSQFPDSLTDDTGVFTKPAVWEQTQ